MNVGQLKKVIENVDDDVEILTSGSDHAMISCFAEVHFVESLPGGCEFFEYFGDEHMAEDSDKILALIII